MHNNAASTSSPKNHPKHKQGEHHRNSRVGGSKKGGNNERRVKVDKRLRVAAVEIGGGRYGHSVRFTPIFCGGITSNIYS